MYYHRPVAFRGGSGTREQRARMWWRVGIPLAAGGFGLVGLILSGLGHHREAAMLALTGGTVGAFFAAATVLQDEEQRLLQGG